MIGVVLKLFTTQFWIYGQDLVKIDHKFVIANPIELFLVEIADFPHKFLKSLNGNIKNTFF